MEEVTQQYKDNLLMSMPLNEALSSPMTSEYYDSTTPIDRVLEIKNREQSEIIEELRLRVSELTRIINVIAPPLLKPKFPKRTLNEQE